MIFAAFTAALALSASCNKEARYDAPEQPALRTVTFNALPTDTKTVFGDKSGNKYPVLWQEGDKVCPSFNFAAVSSDNYITVEPSSDGTSASFRGDFPDAESYQFIFVSPAAVFKSINKTNRTVMVEFPSGQASTAASPDPEAQILYANTGELTELPNPLDLNFSHLAAYLHLQFANVNLGSAKVQAVNVTNEDYPLAGRIFYNIDNDTFDASTEFHTIAVATSTLSDVWCALCPADFSGKQMTIAISTDQGTLTKTVNLPASANLTRGKIAKFTVDMTDVPIVAPVVYKAITSVSDLNVGDKVIIAAAGVDQAFAMSTGQNTNNRSAAGVTKTETEIVNPIETVEILEVEDGVIPGHYAFKATGNPGYIYAGNQASSGDNVLKTKATMDNSASWAISIEDVTVGEKTWQNATRMFADIPSSGRGLLRFNSGSKLFAAYGNGTSQEAIKLYRLDEPADDTPRFKATLPDGNQITSDAQDVKVYVWGNTPWTASVTGDATLDATSGTGNTVLTLSVPENTDVENTKSYSVTVTTSAAVATQSFTLNLTQAKNPGSGPRVVYSFVLKSGNNYGSNGSYAGECDAVINDITWHVTGVSNSTSYDGWRIGGNAAATFTNEDRAIYSKTAIPSTVTKVIATHNAKSRVTVNSFTLTVHSTASDAASGANPIASVSGTFSITDPTEFVNPNQDTPWVGCFYRLTYNLTKTSTAGNGYVQFGGLEMWGYPAD